MPATDTSFIIEESLSSLLERAICKGVLEERYLQG